MTSPCGKIRIPINEEGKEQAGQIQEYLDLYRGEGIQHIAMGSDNLYKTVDALRANGVKLLDTIDTYYELVDKRIPGHGESVEELQKRKILIDGKKDALLLQIFSENQLGPDLLRVHPAQGRRRLRRTATSRRCSRASSSTRCAAGCWPPHNSRPITHRSPECARRLFDSLVMDRGRGLGRSAAAP